MTKSIQVFVGTLAILIAAVVAGILVVLAFQHNPWLGAATAITIFATEAAVLQYLFPLF
jgi:branched-subunit amino acid transport protein AzlD